MANCLKQTNKKPKEIGSFIIKMGPVCQIRGNEHYREAVMNHGLRNDFRHDCDIIRLLLLLLFFYKSTRILKSYFYMSIKQNFECGKSKGRFIG